MRMIRRCVIGFVAMLLYGSCSAHPAPGDKDQPNPLVTYVDDCSLPKASPAAPAASSVKPSPSVDGWPLLIPVAATASAPWTRMSKASGGDIAVSSTGPLELTADGKATGTLNICNTAAKRKLRLSASQFHFADRSDGHELRTAAKFSGASADDRKVIEDGADFDANKCVAVRLEVSGLGPAATAFATLQDAGKEQALLIAGGHKVPFNIKVDSVNPNRADLSFVHTKDTYLRLRNEDPLLYRVHWELTWGERVAHGCSFLQPKASTEIRFKLHDDRFPFFETGLLRSETRQGKFTVRHMPDDSARNLPMPSQTFESTSKLSYSTDTFQSLGTAATILAFLLAGVLTSLLVNFGLPMQRKKVNLKQQLSEVESSLNGQANLFGSRVVNALRVELRRLRAAIEDQSAFVPEAEVTLPRQEMKIGWLAKRVELAKSAGQELAAARQDRTLAQHEIDAIVRACEQALKIVESPALDEKDLARAQAHMDEAAAVRTAAASAPDDEGVEELRRKAQASKSLTPLAEHAGANKLGPADLEVWRELDQLLQDQKKAFELIQTGMPRALFAEAAKAVWKADAIHRYERLVSNAGATMVFRSRIGRAGELLAALTPGKNESMSTAKQLLSEIEQNVSQADLVNALRPGPAAISIEVDPPMPREFQTTTLRLRFKHPGYDAADARRGLKCVWKVDNASLDGDDFTAYHFFEGPRTDFEVSVEVYDGATLLTPKALQAKVRLVLSERLIKTSTWLSLMSLGVTVAVVTLGLMTAAQDKLQSISWLAGIVTLLALGFGADVIKRSLAKSQ
jgi:hypothetical protein